MRGGRTDGGNLPREGGVNGMTGMNGVVTPRLE